jgi:hypothetical protein
VPPKKKVFKQRKGEGKEKRDRGRARKGGRKRVRERERERHKACFPWNKLLKIFHNCLNITFKGSSNAKIQKQ